MQDGKGKDGKGKDRASGADSGGTREQRAGEGATTRFGMEEGDNSETPATGGPTADEEEA